MTEPGSRIALQSAQLADDAVHGFLGRDDTATILSKDQIGELQRVLDEPDCSIDHGNPGGSDPWPLFMAPVIRVDKGRARLAVKTRTIDRGEAQSQQSVSNAVQIARDRP